MTVGLFDSPYTAHIAACPGSFAAFVSEHGREFAEMEIQMSALALTADVARIAVADTHQLLASMTDFGDFDEDLGDDKAVGNAVTTTATVNTTKDTLEVSSAAAAAAGTSTPTSTQTSTSNSTSTSNESIMRPSNGSDATFEKLSDGFSFLRSATTSVLSQQGTSHISTSTTSTCTLTTAAEITSNTKSVPALSSASAATVAAVHRSPSSALTSPKRAVSKASSQCRSNVAQSNSVHSDEMETTGTMNSHDEFKPLLALLNFLAH
jgi:hypothetical protein